jgi:hypothetical protein
MDEGSKMTTFGTLSSVLDAANNPGEIVLEARRHGAHPIAVI